MPERPSRPIRSDAYQWRIAEIPCESASIEYHLSRREQFAWLSDIDQERLFDLEARLRAAVLDLVNRTLTPHQRAIWELRSAGLNQAEIAAKLGLNQSSINKALRGNDDYRRGKVYGGIPKKLRRHIVADPACLALMHEIYTTVDNETPTYLPYYGAARAAFGSFVAFEKAMEAHGQQ